MLGGGATGAASEIAQLAELMQAPVTAHRSGRGIVADDTAYGLGLAAAYKAWLNNKHAEIAPHVPMGGIKSSGIGVEFGEEGLAAYTNIKIINTSF